MAPGLTQLEIVPFRVAAYNLKKKAMDLAFFYVDMWLSFTVEVYFWKVKNPKAVFLVLTNVLKPENVRYFCSL